MSTLCDASNTDGSRRWHSIVKAISIQPATSSGLSADLRHQSIEPIRKNVRRLTPVDEILLDDICLNTGVVTYLVLMSKPTTDSSRGPSRITHGSVRVLAYLHERDGICSVVARETDLAESSVYRWLTELDDAGILDSEATRNRNSRPVVEYHLPDEELGEAAQVMLDRLG